MKPYYIVMDPHAYERFRSEAKALECAKTDVGLDGWEPCTELVVFKAITRIRQCKEDAPLKVEVFDK